jgi:hypothetical protein
MNSHQRTLLSSLGFADVDKKDPRHDLAGQYLSQAPILRALIEALTLPWVEDGHWMGGIQAISVQPEHHITRGTYTVGFADLWVSYRAVPRRSYLSDRKWQIEELAKAEIKRRATCRDATMEQAYRAATGKEPHDYSSEMWQWRRQYEQEHRFDQVAAADKTALEEWKANALASRPVLEWDESRKEWVERAWGPSESGVVYRLLIEVKITPTPIGDIMRQFALYDQHLFNSVAATYPPRLVLASAFDLTQSDVETLRLKSIHHIRLGPKFDVYCADRLKAPQKSLSLEF